MEHIFPQEFLNKISSRENVFSSVFVVSREQSKHQRDLQFPERKHDISDVPAVLFGRSCFECIENAMPFESVIGVIKFSFARLPLAFLCLEERGQVFFALFFKPSTKLLVS